MSPKRQQTEAAHSSMFNFIKQSYVCTGCSQIKCSLVNFSFATEHFLWSPRLHISIAFSGKSLSATFIISRDMRRIKRSRNVYTFKFLLGNNFIFEFPVRLHVIGPGMKVKVRTDTRDTTDTYTCITQRR